MESRSVTIRFEKDDYRFLRQEMVDAEDPNLSETIRRIIKWYKATKQASQKGASDDQADRR